MTPSECAELFVKITEELNASTQRQMQGILNIVVAGLEAAKSPSKDQSDVVQKLSQLIDELKNVSTVINNGPTPVAAPADQNAEKFCAQVEADLNIAMQNFSSNQQQLNQIGQAALGKVLELLIKLHQ